MPAARPPHSPPPSAHPNHPALARTHPSSAPRAARLTNPEIRFPRAILPEILPETQSGKNSMQQQVRLILHGQMAGLAKRKPFNQRVPGSKPTRAPDRPRRPKPKKI